MKVKSLWRYPVKSLLGEQLSAAVVTELGIDGDRIYALKDGDAIVSAKRTGSLFRATSRYVGGGVEILWPDGATSRDGDEDVDRRLAELSGRNVVLAHRDRAPSVEIISGPDSTTTEGPDGRFTGMPGTFFDSAPLHIVTTSSLALLSSLYPEGSVDERRFRPNILVETGAEPDAVEQGWIGREVTIGEIVVRVRKACKRCVMTTHAQSELPRDKGILRTLARSTDNAFGVLADIVVPGTVQVGDEVAPARMPG